MFGSIRSHRKINKLHERSLRLCHNNYTSSYDELLTIIFNYCGLEAIAYKGPQLCQQLPANKKKGSPVVSFKQNNKLRKDPKCSYQIYQTYIGGLGFV